MTLYDRSTAKIDSIIYEKGTFQVFNFEVADYHTYFVSDERVLVHNSGPCDLIAKNLSSVSGNHFHKVLNITDAHKVAAKKFGVNVDDFSNAVASKDFATLKKMGFDVKGLGNGGIAVSKGNIRYRSPVTKRDGSVQGNIEIKPSTISFGDVDNKSASSLRFKNGKDTVSNNHLTIQN